MKKKNLIVMSSPSGGGKSTFAKHLRNLFTDLKFSISATTRQIRPGELNGREYYFLSKEDFQKHIDNNDFVEYEEIFGNQYGTLKSEIESAIVADEKIIFDIDVLGGISIKKLFPDSSLLIFISPPNLEVLENRLRNRKTESEEQIQKRLGRATMELKMSDEFDYIIYNNDLNHALSEAEEIVRLNCY